VDNALGGSDQRYPRVDVAALPPHDLVVLPDEPYAFSETDGPECFEVPAACVSGRHLTCYGPSLGQARGLRGEPPACTTFSRPAKCVSGRHLTWYGPSLVEARELLTAQLAAARWSR